MGAFIGSTSVDLHGETVDINNDQRITEICVERTRKLLATRSPIDCKNLLVDVLARVQLITVKLAFVLNQTGLRGAQGVTIDTVAQFYDQLATLAGVQSQPAEGSQIMGPDGSPIEAANDETEVAAQAAEPVAASVPEDAPIPDPIDEL